MKIIYGVFFLLILSVTVSSGVVAAPPGGKRVASMQEFNAVVCSYVDRKMREGLSERGVEKLINEHAQTIEVLSSIYRNLDCAKK